MCRLSNQRSLTYEVSHLVCDSTRRSDEGIVTLIVLHLHLKKPCDEHKNDNASYPQLKHPISSTHTLMHTERGGEKENKVLSAQQILSNSVHTQRLDIIIPVKIVNSHRTCWLDNMRNEKAKKLNLSKRLLYAAAG